MDAKNKSLGMTLKTTGSERTENIYTIISANAKNAPHAGASVGRVGLSPNQVRKLKSKLERREERERIQRAAARRRTAGHARDRKLESSQRWLEARDRKREREMALLLTADYQGLLGSASETIERVRYAVDSLDVDGINSLVTNVNQVVGKLKEQDVVDRTSDVISRLTTTTSNLDRTANEVTSALDGFTAMFKGIKDRVTDMFESFKKSLPVVLCKVAMVAFLAWASIKGLAKLVVKGIAAIGKNFYSCSWWGQACDAVVEESTTTEAEVPKEGLTAEAQSGEATINWLARLASFISVGTAMKESKDKQGLGLHLFNLVSSKMTAHPRTMSGFEDLFKFIIESVEKGVNTIRGYFNLPHWRMLNRWSEEIDAVIVEAHNIEAEENKGGCAPEYSSRLARIQACHYKLRKFQETYKWNRDINFEMEKACRVMEHLGTPLKRALGEGTGYKPLPLSLVMFGKPGVGKTLMTQALTNALLVATGEVKPGLSAEESSRLIFTKPFNTEYLDGYHGQPVYLMDDFMLKKANPTDSSNGFTDLMTFYSSFTTLCNMATCENKGMFPFTSKIIMMTTNMKKPSQAGVDQILIETQALNRRVDLNYEVRVRKEFRKDNTTMLDYQKFQEELALCDKRGHVLQQFPWHIWEVFPQSWDAHVEIPEDGSVRGYPFTKLIVEAVKIMKQRARSHVSLTEMCTQMLNARAPTDEELEAMYQGGPSMPLILSRFFENPEGVLYQGSAGPSSEAGESDLLHSTIMSTVRSVYQDCEIVPEVDPTSAVLEHDEEFKSFMLEIRSNASSNGSDGVGADEYIADPNVVDVSSLFSEEPVSRWAQVRKNIMLHCSTMWRIVKDFVRWCVPYLNKFGAWTILCAISVGAITFLVDCVKAVYRYIRGLFCPREEQSNRATSGRVKFASLQSSGVAELCRNVYRNGYLMLTPDATGFAVQLGQVTFLKRDYAVLPTHFHNQLRGLLKTGISGDNPLYLRSNKTGQCINFTIRQWLDFPSYEFEDRDITVVRTNLVAYEKDITHLLLTEKDLLSVSNQPVRLDVSRLESEQKLNSHLAYLDRVKYVDKGRLAVGRDRPEACEVVTVHKRWLAYSAPTKKGDCGAGLCLQEARRFGSRIWMGIHVGANDYYREAYATVLTAEDVEKAISTLALRTRDPVVEELTQAETVAQAGLDIPAGFDVMESDDLPFGYLADVMNTIIDDESQRISEDEEVVFGNLTCVGSMTKNVCAPVKSGLEPTPLFKEKAFESLVPGYNLVPMKLGKYYENDEPVYPMFNALEPFAQPQRAINEYSFKSAVYVGMRLFAEATSRVNGVIWDVKEAILGRSGAAAIPRGTSVGLPMCIEYKDKSYFLGEGVDFDVSGPNFLKFESEVRGLEALLKQGKRPFFVARGFLKDETRKEGKNARYIAGTSIHYYVLCRMYFGEIVAQCMDTLRQHGMVCGINPYQDWEWLHNWVTAKGDKVWDGDFAGFDSSQQPQMLWALLDYINDWYRNRGASEEDCRVRSILFLDLVKSRHAVGQSNVSDTVVQWQKSLPSGHFLTGFVNSMLSMSCLVSAYMSTVGDNDFHKHCRASTQGDDNLVNAADKVIDRFNQISTAEHLSRAFGMTYTAGRKGEELKPYLAIEDVSFLQRSFRIKNGRVVGPIRLESCLCNMYYTKKGDADYKREVLTQMVENNLSELSLHEEDIFLKGRDLLLEACKQLKYEPRFSTATSKDYFDHTCKRQDFGFV
jgi:hypothetical protein